MTKTNKLCRPPMPCYAPGGFLNMDDDQKQQYAQTAGTIGTIGAGIVDATASRNDFGNISTGAMVGKDALQGAAMGSQFGPIGSGIGAVIGAGVGLIQGGKLRRDERSARAADRRNTLMNQNNYSAALIGANPEIISGGRDSSMFKDGGNMKSKQSRNVAESTGLRRPAIIPLPAKSTPPVNNDTLKALPANYNFPDSRSWGNPSRVKERMDLFQKGTSVLQLAPIPIVKYPAMALNTALGAVDVADDLKKGDDQNLNYDILSSIPLPEGPMVKSLAAGTRAATSAQRGAVALEGLGLTGIAADVTGNFGNKKATGGSLTRNNSSSVTYNPEAYTSFGDKAQLAFDQGWMPHTSSAQSNVYTNRYGLLNKVVIPGDPRPGNVGIVSHGSKFDVTAMDADGKPFGERMVTGGSYDDVNKYFSSNGNIIGQCSNQILRRPEAGTTAMKYANGGTLQAPLSETPAQGGNATSLSSDSVQFNGNSHDQGGIQLPQVGAEVEGGETAKGSFVFSKELGFARLHRPIAKAIGVIEQKPQTADRIGALRRLKQQEQELAQSQEHLKALNGIS